MLKLQVLKDREFQAYNIRPMQRKKNKRNGNKNLHTLFSCSTEIFKNNFKQLAAPLQVAVWRTERPFIVVS